MPAVATAAANLDAAIATFHTALAAYIDACGSGNATLRAAGRYRNNNRLESCFDHVRSIVGQNERTANALGIPTSGPGLTLAQVHGAD